MDNQENNKKIDANKIATLTGKAIQDDETYKTEGGFIPERDQFYFEMQQEDSTFLVGFKEILICLKLMEQFDEVPKLPPKWWIEICRFYGYDIYDTKAIKENKEKENERN